MLHLLPLSLSAQCRCGGPPSRRRFVGGGSPSQRTGPGLLANGARVRLQKRALGGGTDVQPDTPSSRRDADERQHADAEQEDEGGGGELLDSVRKLLLLEDTVPGEEEDQGLFPKRWAIVFLCFSAFLLCNMDRVNMSIAIMPMSAEYGWNPQTVGLIQSSFFWGYLLTQIAGGIWADKVGGKTVLGFGVIWWSVATALTPVAAKLGLPFLLVVRAFMGVGEGVAMPAMNNILSKWVPVSERSRSLALVYSGMYLGSVTGLAFSPFLIHKFGWPSVFYSFGSLGTVWFATWATKAYSTPLEDPGISAKEKKLLISQTTSGDPVTTIPWGVILSKPPVWALIACHFCHNWGTFILLTWMPTYYNQVLKFNLTESSLFCVLPWLTMAISANVGGWIADTLVSRGTSVTTVRKIPAPWPIVGLDQPPPSWDPVRTPVFDMKPSLHPVGTPKFNMKRASIGVKKTPPTNKKKKSPKAIKARAQWNLGLEKSLVDILHEHNNDYYRAQNGWSGDTWNRMTQIFQERNEHVNFVKSQLQDKEKELKREYKMLKEARMQSGAGWDEKRCKIVADQALWDNLEISCPKIGKFKKHDFPLFDSLGDLYDGQIAEGNYNFTSTSKASQLDEEFEEERVQEAISEFDEDIQILDEDPTQKKDEGTSSSVSQVNVGERTESEKQKDKKNAGGPKKNPPKELKKANKSDEMVQVVDRYVKMKEKQAEDEKIESNAFSIAKCISTLHKMEEFTREDRVKASKIFRIPENRETFLTWAAEDQECAIIWLRGELQELL